MIDDKLTKDQADDLGMIHSIDTAKENRSHPARIDALEAKVLELEAKAFVRDGPKP